MEPTADAEPPSRLALGTLATIAEFAQTVADVTVGDEDRRVHSEHPVVVALQAALESLSSSELGLTIVGWHKESRDSLVASRKSMEARDSDNCDVGLQQVLYAFEQVCDVLHESLYVSGTLEDSRTFFVDAVPEWIHAVAAWAGDHDDQVAETAAADTAERYEEVVNKIVGPRSRKTLAQRGHRRSSRGG